jgi:hypothetical protein
MTRRRHDQGRTSRWREVSIFRDTQPASAKKSRKGEKIEINRLKNGAKPETRNRTGRSPATDMEEPMNTETETPKEGLTDADLSVKRPVS